VCRERDEQCRTVFVPAEGTALDNLGVKVSGMVSVAIVTAAVENEGGVGSRLTILSDRLVAGG